MLREVVMVRYTLALALASFVALAAAPVPPAPAPKCLHGSPEKADQRARRMEALAFAKQLNTLEAAGKMQAQNFYPFEDLPLLPKLPDGFKPKMSTDGFSYAFSVKDTLDPCGFAYFSDQDAIVYAATPVP
jgi:hypothetical protein